MRKPIDQEITLISCLRKFACIEAYPKEISGSLGLTQSKANNSKRRLDIISL